MDCPDCGQRHAQRSPDCPATRVGAVVAGRYRLLRLIGAGGMGAVFEAEHLALGTRVALKTILSRAARGSEAVARFEREARAVADIRHPGIVDVKDLGQDADGSPFMVLELLEGRDAWSLLSDGPLPVDRAVWIASEALDALAVAHARGIIHRDLKPANVFVAQVPRVGPGGEGGERVKILDFGLAKVLEPERVALTRTGYFMGSAPYMSPEQTQDAKRVDERCDIYAMGVTLFELLTGYLPVTGDSSMQMLVRVGAGEINRSPRSLRSDVPAWLDAVVARALAFEPADRFASALEMKAALQAGASATTVEDQANEDSRRTAALVAASAPPIATTLAPTAGPVSRTRPGLAVVVVVALAVIVAVAVVLAVVVPRSVAPDTPVVAMLPVPAVSAPPFAAAPLVLSPQSSTVREQAQRAPGEWHGPSAVSPIVSPQPPALPSSPSWLTPVSPPAVGSGAPSGPVSRISRAEADRDPAPPSDQHEDEDAPSLGPEDDGPDERAGVPAVPEPGSGAGLPTVLSAGEFMTVMQRARPAVWRCTEGASVRVEVIFSGRGQVLRVSFLTDPGPAEECVRRAIIGLRFPEFAAPQDNRTFLF